MTVQVLAHQHSTVTLTRETLKELREENQRIADNFLERGYYLHDEIIRINEIKNTLQGGGIQL